MALETDDQIAARRILERKAASAWRSFKAHATGKTRRIIRNLPPTGVHCNERPRVPGG